MKPFMKIDKAGIDKMMAELTPQTSADARVLAEKVKKVFDSFVPQKIEANGLNVMISRQGDCVFFTVCPPPNWDFSEEPLP